MSSASPPQHASAWNPEFTGQLEPRHPRNGGISSPLLDAAGTVVPGVCCQTGPHHSMWLRVSDPSSSVAAAAVTYRASTFDSGALYVAFDEWRSHPVLLGALQQSGFSFYTHTNVSKVGGGGEIVYYKWCRACHDLVPAAASSIEGVYVFALSPDELSVLLVFEQGHWKPVSGAAEPGSTVVETAVRELGEEVGVEVDLAGYAPRYLGGHHQPRSREAHFNDNCVCIALRARSTVFTPDMHEVYQAKWASIASLAVIAERYIQCPPPPSILIDGYTLLHEHERYFWPGLLWLRALARGSSFVCKDVQVMRYPAKRTLFVAE